jgi:S-adenosylmethionine hydrolase
VARIIKSQGSKQAGDLIAVVDSEEYIEIAVVSGNAAQKLGAKAGDSVEASYED